MGLKKLYIDVPAFLKSGISADNIKCEYLFHRNNKGAVNIIEAAEFSAYCRECKDAFCVSVCPNEALEHLEDGTIKRYNMRCVGCKSCTLACPFGTIFPEMMDYITSGCDMCLNQLHENENYQPACVRSSGDGFLMMKEFEQEEKDIFFIGKHLAVKNNNWRRKEGKL